MIAFDIAVIESAIRHAQLGAPRESCGVVIVFKGRQQFRPCANLSPDGQQFVVDPADYAAASEAGEVLGIVHSHVGLPPEPSMADRVGVENTGVPWLIVNVPLGTHTVTYPSGYAAPLYGRPFIHGVLDCYAFLRDWYKQEQQIDIPDFNRAHDWWLHGQNIIAEQYMQAGFHQIPEGDLQVNDVMILKVGSPVPNHCAVMVDDNVVGHHAAGRLSSRDVYGGWLRSATALTLRHEAFA